MTADFTRPPYCMAHTGESSSFVADQVTNARDREKLIKTGWVLGFVDGEGCFSIAFVRQPGGSHRKGYTTGFQVTHEFSVTQGAKSISSLEELRDFFGTGQIIHNTRYDNHKEHLCRYVVRRREDLQHVVIPFFRQYPLRTANQTDFERFAKCVELISKGCHLSKEGVIRIAEIAATMNRRKPRDDLIRILIGPNAQ